MDRRAFFSQLWRRVGRECLELTEDTAVGKALDQFVEVSSPRKKERPPGAIAEADFLQRCTGCDACMAACPENVVMIEDLERRDPWIYPEEQPCLHCEGYPCIAACKSGALVSVPQQ